MKRARKTYLHTGAYRTMSEIARIEGVSPQTIYKRISGYGSVEKRGMVKHCSKCGKPGHVRTTCGRNQ